MPELTLGGKSLLRTPTYRAILLCATFLIFSGAAAQGQQAKHKTERFRVKGFLQTRLTNVGGSSGNKSATQLQATRLRPTMTYDFDAHFRANAQINLTTRGRPLWSVTGRDVYLEYHNTGFAIRAGQSKVPFGYEIYQEGDEIRAALERARVLSVLFPDEREFGLFFSSTAKNSRGPVYAAAATNGEAINTRETGVGKNFSLRAVFPLQRNQTIGASLYTGASHAVGGASRVKQAFGVEYRGHYRQWSAQFEYLWGRQGGSNLNGGYGQAVYAARRSGNVFVRHDIFDPNTSVGNDMWNRTSIGWYKDFGLLRATAEYDIAKNERTPTGDNTFGIQIQLRY